jgi:hypothetical protein
MALQVIGRIAQGADANTMALQYMDTLRQVGSSPSTKFVLPMEMTGIAQAIAATLGGSARAGENGGNGANRGPDSPADDGQPNFLADLDVQK